MSCCYASRCLVDCCIVSWCCPCDLPQTYEETYEWQLVPDDLARMERRYETMTLEQKALAKEERRRAVAERARIQHANRRWSGAGRMMRRSSTRSRQDQTLLVHVMPRPLRGEATTASSGGRDINVPVHVGRRGIGTLPVLLAGVTVFVVVLVWNEGKIQTGYLRYIAISRQYASYRRPRVGFSRSAPSPSCSSSAVLPPSMYNFSEDPRPPPALVSYPGSGSTLTRLLLEMGTHIYSGSVYGDFSLYNNTGHKFLGEFNTTSVSVVKVRPSRVDEFGFCDDVLRNPE